jgi:hypothetical protein
MSKILDRAGTRVIYPKLESKGRVIAPFDPKSYFAKNNTGVTIYLSLGITDFANLDANNYDDVLAGNGHETTDEWPGLTRELGWFIASPTTASGLFIARLLPTDEPPASSLT